MSGATTELSSAVLDVVVLPSLGGLSEQQRRGVACVWCGVILAPGTAVGLGERRVRILDGHVTTFPRGCRRCTGQAAYNALFDHAPMCEQCADNAAECDTGRELRRLVKEGFRR